LNTLHTQCPTDETLALFAAGDLEDTERTNVLDHVEECRECLSAVLAAVEHLREESAGAAQPATSHRWWLSAVAAAAFIGIVAVPLWHTHQPSVGTLAALAPKSDRVLEARLSGGFAWAPYHGPARSTDPAPDVSRLKLGGAAGELIERAENDPGADAQHAAGLAMVLVDKPQEGAARLEAVARSSRDAATWSDLAAAQYEAAIQLRQPSLFARALASAGEALQSNPRSTEALFNRALILERMERTADARAAWQRYLAVDPSSPWASEARERLASLGR
jgi:hypothetical protein